MPNIIGKWDLLNGVATWEFTKEGKFIETSKNQAGNNSGTWEIVDDMIVIKYDNPEIGYSVLSFEEENNIVGENKHKDGSMYNLNLKRV